MGFTMIERVGLVKEFGVHGKFVHQILTSNVEVYSHIAFFVYRAAVWQPSMEQEECVRVDGMESPLLIRLLYPQLGSVAPRSQTAMHFTSACTA
jgi:hypothetical protein